MLKVRVITLLFAALLLNSAIDAGVSFLKPAEPQSGIRRQITGRLQNAVGKLPDRLRSTAEQLVSATDIGEKRRLIEILGDSSLDSVGDLFADLLVHEPVASVRLDLVNYLN